MEVEEGYRNWNVQTNYIPKERIVHIDLKGAPPIISYYSKFFPLIKKYGATGVLLEYEDMFPYIGSIKSISRDDCYSEADIKEIISLANINGLEVIPLIQTFGHFEFILKHRQFAHLREVEMFPNALCPTRGESFDIIKSMIDQVVEMHPGLKRLHIGADEVYHLGQCSLCRERKMAHGLNNDELFLQHITKVVRYIKASYAHVKILMWDDMLRHVDDTLIRGSGLGQDVEAVVWFYRPHVYGSIRPEVWIKYASTFPTVWGASAFKGATGESIQLTNASYHLDNNYEWLTVLKDQSSQFPNIPGLILTGWQRYNHFTPLCELLPVGIPSLLANLALIGYGKFDLGLHSSMSKDLNEGGSESLIPLNPFPRPQAIQNHLSFPGHEVYTFVNKHLNIVAKVEQLLHELHHEGDPEYNYLDEKSIEIELLKCKEELKGMLEGIFLNFDKVYASRSMHEWKDTFIKPYIKRIENGLHN